MLTLIQQANQFSKRTAIVSNGKAYTYEDILKKSSQVAKALLQSKSDLQEARIAFLIPPSFEYVAVQWGIWRAGGIAVPLCVLHPISALEYVIEDTDAAILIVDDEYYKKLAPIAKKRKTPLWKIEEFQKEKELELPEVEESRRAMILYTSGTTSKPKGVVTTHSNINFQIKTLVDAWEWSKEDRILNILPLHHVHGIINVLSCALWSGACCEFLPKFEAKKVWDKFQEGQLTLFMAVPTIYFKLIAFWEKASESEQLKMSSFCRNFRLMVSGSAALPVSILEKWRTISNMTLLERYGMTEIGMALSNSYTGERRPGHVGLPLPGVELQLVNDAGEKVEKGEQGEIQIKGENVFLEYWNKKEATVSAFTKDGWFKTGDISIFNKGSYKILGRNSVDIIKSGGYKISALEIEEILRKHPKIKECGVVGLPDEEWGEIIVASLVLIDKGLDFNELREWLKDKLPSYKMPRRFIIQDDLPRNTLGKVIKNELKKNF